MATNLPTFPVTFTENDTQPDLTGVLASTDITGYTITLHLERPGTTVLTKTATITDGPNGAFSVSWSAGDLVTGCGQKCEIQFVDTGGGIVTSQKFLLDVDPEIA